MTMCKTERERERAAIEEANVLRVYLVYATRVIIIKILTRRSRKRLLKCYENGESRAAKEKKKKVYIEMI